MEYASGRLLRQSIPRAPSIRRARRRLTFRDGLRVSLPLSANISYAHGESWTDAANNASLETDRLDSDGDGFIDEDDERRGAWMQGEAWQDTDGDGRLGVWSGRLRGAQAGDARFSLKIASQDSKIPLNAGHLDNFDRDYAVSNTGPDRCDLTVPYHLSLAHVLNNLGAVLRPVGAPNTPPGGWTRRASILSTGIDLDMGAPRRFEISFLGDDLIRNRPLGGYKTWRQVETTLFGISGALGGPYKQAELDLIRPFIDLGPYETMDEGGRGFFGFPFTDPNKELLYPPSIPPYVPISWSAPQKSWNPLAP